MDTKLDELVSAYLDGDLDSDEARRLEERLGDADVASALSRELGLRDWLTHVGPESAPDHLTRQLQLAVTTQPLEEEETKPARFLNLRAALAGMSWMARGPALAVSTVGAPVVDATKDLGAVGSAVVAPLTSGRTPRKKKTRSTKRKLGSLAWKLLRRK